VISSKASSSSSYSRSMVLLVAGTIRYGLLLTATTHRRITPFSRVALSSYSYSTSSYSSGGVDDDDDNDADIYDGEMGCGVDEMDAPATMGRAAWTTDLVQ
jgi:hypothetical protein